MNDHSQWPYIRRHAIYTLDLHNAAPGSRWTAGFRLHHSTRPPREYANLLLSMPVQKGFIRDALFIPREKRKGFLEETRQKRPPLILYYSHVMPFVPWCSDRTSLVTFESAIANPLGSCTFLSRAQHLLHLIISRVLFCRTEESYTDLL